MVVLNPLKVTIQNFPHKNPVKVSVPNFPTQPEKGNHKITFDKVIYIEKDDFMEVGDKSFRRLTKQQSVGLRYAGVVLDVVEVIKNASNEPIELLCNCTQVDKVDKKPKAFIHWVSDPEEVEVRIYDLLFKHKNPEDANQVPGGFLSDCNLNSLRIIKSYADKYLGSVKIYDKFQFERLGFFSVDPDSSADKIVFNQTVPLKEEAGK